MPAGIKQTKRKKNMQKPTLGQKIEMSVYGKLQTVTVLAVYKFGTMDIETETGACFRVTGLSFI
jgi:Lon protease-like protein